MIISHVVRRGDHKQSLHITKHGSIAPPSHFISRAGHQMPVQKPPRQNNAGYQTTCTTWLLGWLTPAMPSRPKSDAVYQMCPCCGLVVGLQVDRPILEGL
jgi:hypothetical protein